MITVFYTEFDAEFDPRKWEALCAPLPVKMVEGILRYRRWQDRHSALLGKLMLAHALGGKESFPLLEELQYTAHNRPYLVNKPDFNISHSGRYVLCALADHGGVGVDVEEIKPIEMEQFTRIMSADEWEDIHHSEKPVDRFYRYWTVKESVIKADGRGLSIPLQHVNAINSPVSYDSKLWHLQPLALSESYAASLAFDTPQEIRTEVLQF